MSALLQPAYANDPDNEGYTRAEEAAIEREARVLTACKLVSAEWWDARLEEMGTAITAELPYLLSNCAAKALAAETTKGRGVEILDAGIALSVTQFILRQGRERAATDARHEAEEKLVAGELA